MLGHIVTKEQYTNLICQARARQDRWLDFDSPELNNKYNRLPFLCSHRLTDHPLFSLDALFALCRSNPELALHRYGDIPEDAHFDTSLSRYRHGLTLSDAIDHFEEKKAYIVIYNPEKNPDYKMAIDGFIGEIGAATEALDPWINWYSSYVFITTCGSVTPYHMDREMNFLLQVRGTKTAQLWDPLDQRVMSSEQTDNLFVGGADSRPTYVPELRDMGMTFHLRPGLGLHHPFIAPHLILTVDALSISLAITFRTKRSDVWTDAHLVNLRLRQLGLYPTPVRQSERIDQTKSELRQLARKMRNIFRR